MRRPKRFSERLKGFAEVADGVFLAPENRVVYRTVFLEARFDPIDVPGYQVGIVSLDPDADALGPRAVRRRPGTHGQFTGD